MIDERQRVDHKNVQSRVYLNKLIIKISCVFCLLKGGIELNF